MAVFEYVDHEHERGISLYYEDECIAIDTWDKGRNPSGVHEIMLNPQTVDLLIQALTEMKANINLRYQKAITQ